MRRSTDVVWSFAFVLAMLAVVGPGIALASISADVSDSEPVEQLEMLEWSELPALPDALGVAGPVVGVHNDALIVGGGANFPVAEGEDLWEVSKVWHDDAWVLVREKDEDGKPSGELRWIDGFKLDRPVGYGACVSMKSGVACLGGCDANETFDECFIISWDPETEKLTQSELPSLPQPCAFGSAAVMGGYIYIAGGMSGSSLDTAMNNFWRLKIESPGVFAEAWEVLPAWEGPTRAVNITVAQHNGFNDCVYVISGRRQREGTDDVAGIECLTDVYEFNPTRFDATLNNPATGEYTGESPWRQRADVPACVMAGSAVAIGQSHVFVLSGADGSLLTKAAELKDDHPGFPRRTWAYHTITDTWVDSGASPSNQVTTPPVKWDDQVIIASGEIRPRVRTTTVWAIKPISHERTFGAINFTVLIVYLLSMVGIGVYFMRKNNDTNDYFRGGQKIVWWAAGCSIFATMLSSITFMAIPAKAFAQDMVYLVGNMMILAVAPIAVYIALPFFRRIDATSAYEYLDRRFNYAVRMFASASFTLFHVFRMGIVMSLAALALSTVADFSGLFGFIGLEELAGSNANAVSCVVIMGILSVLYCTMGGVEAVVWTDTIQTFVLLGGALLCLVLMIVNCDGGVGQFMASASEAGKLNLVNFHWDATSASLALWVVIIGAIGQNLSSYTADQAVVQRYMTTPSQKRAASSIWTAAWLAMPSSVLFFAIGAGLFAFYQANPERLDPTFTTDQIFPLFIANEVPVGIAGLIVAGIFAAAQSTISTSMNSTATIVVTDFLRPMNFVKNEKSYLRWAQVLTLTFGLLGMLLGIVFVNPDIKSLFESFIKVIGLFMGVLGGLFILGIMTRRVGGYAALAGSLAGAAVMGLLPIYTQINGYIYATIGISVCFVVGYAASFILPGDNKSTEGLTIFDIKGLSNEEKCES